MVNLWLPWFNKELGFIIIIVIIIIIVVVKPWLIFKCGKVQ